MLKLRQLTLSSVILLLSFYICRGCSNSNGTNDVTIPTDFTAPIREAFTHLDDHSKHSNHRCFRHFRHFDDEFIRRQIASVQQVKNMTELSSIELNATLWLAKAAVHLPGGDFVEAGNILSINSQHIFIWLDCRCRKLWFRIAVNPYTAQVRHMRT
jgi:hypothetical protein